MDVDGHEHAKAEHDRGEGGAAIGDQGEWHAADRDQAHHHCEIDEAIHEQVGGDAEGGEAAEHVVAAECCVEGHGDHGEEHADQHQRARETELLGDDGEHEIGLFFGQEIKLVLGAVQETLAPEAAGAERDFRLDDIIARAQRIAAGMQEGEDALFLVAVQMVINERGGDGDDSDHDGEFPPAHACAEQDGAADGHGDDGGAEIGFLEDQDRRGEDGEQRWDQESELADPLIARALEPGGEG